jgi:hypothetical protein
MKGYLLLFKAKPGKDAIRLNHRLLGRIISVCNKGITTRYYRAGALDNISFRRIANGCYFIKGNIPHDEVDLIKLKVDLEIYDKDLKTGRGYWKSHANKYRQEVKNL